MVIVQVIGGLGNQMFQYAAGRAVAKYKETSLKLDISEFASYPLRTYRLNKFNIVEEFASAKEVKRFIKQPVTKFGKLQQRILYRLTPYYWRATFDEQTLAVADPNIFRVRRDVYLRGYWQSELYFANIADTIRQEFTFKAPPDARNAAMLTEIDRTNAVSLHVRRGDYISNPSANQVHGVADLNYYRAAVDFMCTRVTSPHFFVFSDDLGWVKENLALPFPTVYVDHNGAERDHEDLRLMSHCKYHIIANSSFSWWGAWLATFPQKQVVAPRQWFATIDVDVASRFPQGWSLLSPSGEIVSP